MSHIIANLDLIIIAVGLLLFSTKRQVGKAREWLVYATSCAEKEFGGGTGKLKLRSVYDKFVEKFPWLAIVISFERFSNLVDDALMDMNQLIATNQAVAVYVTGTEVNSKED